MNCLILESGPSWCQRQSVLSASLLRCHDALRTQYRILQLDSLILLPAKATSMLHATWLCDTYFLISLTESNFRSDAMQYMCLCQSDSFSMQLWLHFMMWTFCCGCLFDFYQKCHTLCSVLL